MSAAVFGMAAVTPSATLFGVVYRGAHRAMGTCWVPASGLLFATACEAVDGVSPRSRFGPADVLRGLERGDGK